MKKYENRCELSKGKILANKLKLNVGRSPEVRVNYWTGGDNKINLVSKLACELGFIKNRKSEYMFYFKHSDGSSIHLNHRNLKGFGEVRVFDNK